MREERKESLLYWVRKLSIIPIIKINNYFNYIIYSLIITAKPIIHMPQREQFKLTKQSFRHVFI